MSCFSRLYHGETNYDFVGIRRRFWTASGALLGVSVLSLAIIGFNLGVDFTGGTVVEVENPANASVADVRDVLAGIGLESARVQSVGGGAGIRVLTEELAPEVEQRLVEALAAETGVEPVDANRQTVGPSFGEQVARKALQALVFFLIGVGIFISFRLEWKMAVAALVALIHDLLLTAGIYSLTGFEVTPATVIAILTILGYSLYDTVVVFDKVLENVKERGERHTISSIVNLSMNQVLMRSANTSLTSLLPIGSLLFVGSFLLGAATLREFALALFIGVSAGTYSSIFIASPLLAIWKEREDRWERIRRRVARKGVEDQFETRTDEHIEAVEAVDSVLAMSGAEPRPPKERRRRRR